MSEIDKLLNNNKEWAARCVEKDPQFFDRLSNIQTPRYLWIGCSDSRVPANQITGLLPGEVFVHRNVANVLPNSDLNSLSVIQYAVEVLKVEHIIICGHYGCGGVAAAMNSEQFGLIDNWLRNIKDVYFAAREELEIIKDPEKRLNRLIELNVARQVRNVTATTIVQNAWKRGQKLSVYGWVYSLTDGLLRDLKLSVSSAEQLDQIFNMS
jgi:carbonic anhydrase